MKILYVKNNSERAKAFQLSTIIYEENGVKYVKKQALCTEAIPHLKRMKENFNTLNDAIIHPNIHLAKILHETKNSLTFEYIEGESLETRLQHISKHNKESLDNILHSYFILLKEGFKTEIFDADTMLTDSHKELFGDINFSSFNGKPSFKHISNLDLIFSNILYKDDMIYLIDYEWAYPIHVPIDYVIYRTIEQQVSIPNLINIINDADRLLYHQMEKHFINKHVMHNSFYFYRKNYIKVNYSIMHHLEEKDNYNHRLSKRIHEQDKQIQILGDDLHYARTIIQERDMQLVNMRPKMIIKQKLKKLFSFSFKNILQVKRKSIAQEMTKTYIYTEPLLTEDIKHALKNFTLQPLISIIMPVYNVDIEWLDLALKSIQNQWYQNWELCIADDKSTNSDTLHYLKSINNPKIKITFLDTNLNISEASNKALELATGSYIVLMDNDDEITPDALYELVKTMNEKDADFIYSDEDFISTDGIHSNPHFKPDFSPDLLLSHNYITHLSCFKKSLLAKAGNFNPEFDGSQDYDLFLRLTEYASNIIHIPKVLYHWRMLETSTSINANAKPEAQNRGKRVLEATLERRNIKADVLHANMAHYFRVRYTIINSPLVSIIIPFKDKPELLEKCINSILSLSTYQKFEIIGISNNSKSSHTFTIMSKLEKQDSRVSFYEYNVPFNYADINNHAVSTYAKGEHVLLLNNDIEIITPDWIEAMLEHSQRKEVGCVGAKLYYPNDTIQHAGIIIGLGGYAGHSHKMYKRFNPGYFNRLNVVQNLLAVTAACLMIKKSTYEEVNGMDEIKFKVAYNDVDFCLRVFKAGYLNIFTPFAEMYHHESITRGYETTPEKIARFQTEKDALYERHKDILDHGDPYYNPNLTLDNEDFSLCQK